MHHQNLIYMKVKLLFAIAFNRFKSDMGKIRIFLMPVVKEEIHVSKEGAPEFRRWIEEN